MLESKIERYIRSKLENKLKSKLHVERKVGRHIISKQGAVCYAFCMYVRDCYTVQWYGVATLSIATCHTYVHVRRPGCFVTGKLLINFRKAQTHAYVHACQGFIHFKGGGGGAN